MQLIAPGARDDEGDRLRQARWATASFFLLLGVLFGSWVTRIPEIQNRLALDDGQLGVALLSASAGAMGAMPATAWLIRQWGNPFVIRAAAGMSCATLPLLALAPTMATLMLALLVFGVSFGLLDVAMNTQAAAVEAQYARPIMSSFHGIYSVGGLAGAASASVIAGMNIPVFPHLVGTALSMLALTALGGRALLDVAGRDVDTPLFAVPPKALLTLGLLSLFVLLGEGAVGNWSAVYLQNTLGSTAAVAAIGYAAYSVAMAGLRFGGDPLIARFGAVQVVRLGCLLAAIGMGAALLLGTVPAAIIGFACVGAGLAVAFPAALSAAGRTPGLASGAAIGAVATAGYAGLLLGPPLIGFISDNAGLRAGLGLVAFLCFVSALLASAVRR